MRVQQQVILVTKQPNHSHNEQTMAVSVQITAATTGMTDQVKAK